MDNIEIAKRISQIRNNGYYGLWNECDFAIALLELGEEIIGADTFKEIDGKIEQNIKEHYQEA